MPYVKVNKPKKNKIRRRKFSPYMPRGVRYVDYKQIDILKKFINDQGKIKSAAQTGLTANQQRAMSLAIKRARYMALLPYSIERVRKAY